MARRPRRVRERKRTKRCNHCSFEAKLKDYGNHDAVCERRLQFLIVKREKDLRESKYNKIKKELNKKHWKMDTFVKLRSSLNDVDYVNIAIGVLAQQSNKVRVLVNTEKLLPGGQIAVFADAGVLKTISTYCYHFDHSNRDDDDEINARDESDYFSRVFGLGESAIFRLACGARSLGLEDLLERCVRWLSSRIQSLNEEQLQARLGLLADWGNLSPDQEEVLRQVRL